MHDAEIQFIKLILYALKCEHSRYTNICCINRIYALSWKDTSRSSSSEEYLTIILPVVFCGWENPSLGLREEYRLRVFENTVPRKIFGPKREEVRGELRRLHNEEFYDMYSSQNIIHVV
jgi:hypothetical protein